ncbi:SGNH/GDSL hydrolase family protein [uncultured Devosia sp.]|uniref:SGNH/GDSL hydrolase family protein n=1 Tax=uncultured Devosia sp. TaxID=211434 RepID=UPI0035CBA6EB
MKTVRVTLIGGSNTLMVPGYVTQLLPMAAQRGLHLDVVANLAVGGTSCGYGLYALKTTEAVEQSDLLIVEYGINDGWIYGDERRRVRHWARFYEGIIRHALERNPQLIVCSVVLGARNGTWLGAVPSVDAGMHYLSSWYRSAIIDVNASLLRRYGREVVTNPSFYMDQGHYARPVATAMVAEIVLDGLVDAIAQGPRQVALPPAIDAKNFASAGTVTAALLADMTGQPLVDYRNRIFSLDAFDLAEQQIAFRIEGGKLLSINYACDEATGMVAITRNGKTTPVAMMKGGVANKQFRFLASMLSCDFLYGAQLVTEDEDADYSIALAPPSLASECHIPKDSVAHTDQADAARLPLLGLLYSGTIKDLRITRTGNATAEPAVQPALSAA